VMALTIMPERKRRLLTKKPHKKMPENGDFSVQLLVKSAAILTVLIRECQQVWFGGYLHKFY
ncbi:hypothetical protein, partial [Photobacterium damselae]|uniref:hypothetical protein n=1 Tax=Photobacterium damselae TaxID=38293 RepID=UPI002F425681